MTWNWGRLAKGDQSVIGRILYSLTDVAGPDRDRRKPPLGAVFVSGVVRWLTIRPSVLRLGCRIMSGRGRLWVRRANFFRTRNYLAACLLDSLGTVLAKRPSGSKAGSEGPILSILCLIIDRLGDILMVTSAFRALRQMHPTARLTVAVPSAATELVVNRSEVDEVVCLDPPWLMAGPGSVGRWRLGPLAQQVWILRQRKFDLSISFQPDPRGHLIQRVIDARYRIAPAYKGGGWLLTDAVDTSPHFHILDRVKEVLRSAGGPGPVAPPDLPLAEEVQDRAREFLASYGLTTGRRPVALAPGARDPAKRWALSSWARLAEGIGARDGRPPVLVGGSEDRGSCNAIKSATTGFVVDASGRGILETAALLKFCRVVVTVDSLARHLAAAVGTPVIVLQYGGERPQTWAAYGSNHRLLRKSVPCSPCGQIVCPRPTHDCMQAITPEEILTLLDSEPRQGFGAGAAKLPSCENDSPTARKEFRMDEPPPPGLSRR